MCVSASGVCVGCRTACLCACARTFGRVEARLRHPHEREEADEGEAEVLAEDAPLEAHDVAVVAVVVLFVTCRRGVCNGERAP